MKLENREINRYKYGHSKSKIISFLIVLFTISLLAVAQSQTVFSKTIVKGNNFKVTEKEIHKFQKFYEDHNVFSTHDQYVKAYTRFKLFAQEYQKINNDLEIKKDYSVKEIIKQNYAYERSLIKDYKFPDLIIRSYYRSFPEKFRSDEDGHLKPLNKEVKKQIKNKLIDAKKKDIINQEYKRLSKEYSLE